MTRALVLFLLATPLSAQLALRTGSLTAPDITGVLALNDTLTTSPYAATMFLVNTSSGTLTIPNLSITGVGFTLRDLPNLPDVLGPGSSLTFTLGFAPTATAFFSAALQTGNVSTVVTARGVAAASVYPSTGLAFGPVPYGLVTGKTVTVTNANRQAIPLPAVGVSGPFVLIAPSSSTILNPGTSVSFSIEPLTTQSGLSTGVLTVDTQVFPLTATIGRASLPIPNLSLADPILRSAMQSSLKVVYSEPALTSGTGTVQLAFQPSGDPAAIFLSTGTTTATFSIAAGDASSPSFAFQTGTLSGIITFTAQIDAQSTAQAIALAPDHVIVDRVTLARGPASLDIQLSGFDNTRTASTLNFIFFDVNGKQLGAPVSVAATASFQQYFNTAGLGGMFSLDANFPVTGDASKIDSVEVEILNSAGITQSPRTRF